MKQHRLALLMFIVILLPSGLASAADADVFGKLLVGLEYVDDETDANDYWDMKSHSSRFGIEGDLGTDIESVKVIYLLDWEIDVTDEALASNDHIRARNQYIGVEGSFGQFIVGRNDTPFKSAQGKVDLFNDYVDMKQLMGGGENRESNIFQYTSPKLGDSITVAFMGQPGEEEDGEDNGVADAASLSVAYDSNKLYLAAASDFNMDGDDVNGLRAVVIWKFDSFGVGGLLQTTDWDTGDDEQVFLVNGYYTLNKYKFKAQLGHTENYRGVEALPGSDDNTADYLALGVDFSLSKNTTIGAYLAGFEGGDNLAVTEPAGGPFTRDMLGALIIHNFD